MANQGYSMKTILMAKNIANKVAQQRPASFDPELTIKKTNNVNVALTKSLSA